MSEQKVNKTGKKNFRKEVSHQLEISLGKLKERLSEKKFNSRLKKATKILTKGIDIDKKEQPQKKKPVIEVPSVALVEKPPKKSAKVMVADTVSKVAVPKVAARKVAARKQNRSK